MDYWCSKYLLTFSLYSVIQNGNHESSLRIKIKIYS